MTDNDDLIHPRDPAGLALYVLQKMQVLFKEYDGLVPQLQCAAVHYAHSLAKMAVINAEAAIKADPEHASDRLYLCTAQAPAIAFAMESHAIVTHGPKAVRGAELSPELIADLTAVVDRAEARADGQVVANSDAEA